MVLLVPPGVVTEIVNVPAVAGSVRTAVKDVELATLTLPIVTEVLGEATAVVPDTKSVPVSVTVT